MLRFLFLIFLLISQQVFADTADTSKREAINDLVDVSGMKNVAEILSQSISSEIIRNIKSQNGSLDDKLLSIIQDEVHQVIYDEYVASGWIYEAAYELYSDKLTHSEITAITNFYRSPAGKKAITVLPQATREGVALGEAHAKTIAPKLNKRLVERLKIEGYR